MTKKQREQQRKIGELSAENWNLKHPPGTPVNVTLDNGSVWQTKARTEAWVIGDGDAIVSLEGKAGGYLLERVVPRAD